MKELNAYVDQKNRWNAIFKGAQLNLSKAADRQKIADMIDCDLSPENLSCDGELSAHQVQQKYNFLTRCARELLSIDPSVKMYEYGV